MLRRGARLDPLARPRHPNSPPGSPRTRRRACDAASPASVRDLAGLATEAFGELGG